MIKIKAFSLSMGVVVQRFFLMMALIIVGVFSGMVWMTFLALPVFLSALMGVSIRLADRQKIKVNAVKMTPSSTVRKAS